MSTYQVIARKYRPQSFNEVVGQEAIVTTIKNAIKHAQLAHAYLFCGSRGTGKTTLARIFAKALNCLSLTDSGEPCNKCSSCREITSGTSLDVIEIDGASHRGIDDIRQINETVGYAPSGGKYKVYIIDEVHMLTKEAFNALLKTLEEPPPRVLFLFATTEPHKVLPTILSRCQRFNLNRIPSDKIIAKLKQIAQELKVDVEEQALHLIAQRADGGLRDAESLFDQIIAFHEGLINEQVVADILGLMPRDVFFLLDQAGKEGRLAVAFEIAHQVFSQGKNLIHFVEGLTEHFRTLLLIKLSGADALFIGLLESDKPRYEASAKLYTQEQCLSILEFLIEAQEQIRFQSSIRIALESILLHIMRTHQRVPVEVLVRRLAELEEVLKTVPQPENVSVKLETVVQPSQVMQPSEVKQVPVTIIPTPKEPPPSTLNVTEDPTPTPAELGIRVTKPKEKIIASPPPQPPSPTQVATAVKDVSKQSRYDTLMQFAAIELEGSLRK